MIVWGKSPNNVSQIICMTGTACCGEISHGFARRAIYWMSVGTKPWHHSLRSVPSGRWLFVTLPLVGNSDRAEVETVAADGRDGPEEGAWEGAWEQDLGRLAEGTAREVVCVGRDVEAVVGFL